MSNEEASKKTETLGDVAVQPQLLMLNEDTKR